MLPSSNSLVLFFSKLKINFLDCANKAKNHQFLHFQTQKMQSCAANCISIVYGFLVFRDIHAWLLTCVWFRTILTEQYRQMKSWNVSLFPGTTLPDYVRILNITPFKKLNQASMQFVHTFTFTLREIDNKMLWQLARLFPPTIRSLTLINCNDIFLNRLFSDEERFLMLTHLKLMNVFTCPKTSYAAVVPPSLTILKLSASKLRLAKWPPCLTSLTEKSPQFFAQYSLLPPPPSLRKWKTYRIENRSSGWMQSLLYPNLTYLQMYEPHYCWPCSELSTLITLKLPSGFGTTGPDWNMFIHAQRCLDTLNMPAHGFYLIDHIYLCSHLTTLTLTEIETVESWKQILVQCTNVRNLTLMSNRDIVCGVFLSDCTSVTHLQIFAPNWISLTVLPPYLSHLELRCLRMEVSRKIGFFPHLYSLHIVFSTSALADTEWRSFV